VEFRWTGFQFNNGIPPCLDDRYGPQDLIDLSMDHGSHESSLSTNLVLRLLHDGNGLYVFYSSCPTIVPRLMASSGVAGIFLCTPKDSGVLTFAGTLVFNDCMEWANILRRGGDRLGWHGQKIPFPFPCQLCH